MVRFTNKKLGLLYSLFITVTITYLLLDIAFLNFGQGVLRSDFTQVYFYILLASTITSWITLVVDFTNLIPRSSPISYGFIIEESPLRILGNPRIKLIWRVLPHLVLTGVFVMSSIGLKSSLIPVPDAFKQETLSTVTDIQKIKYQSLNPGFGEEFIIFSMINIFMLFFQRLIHRMFKLGQKFVFYISLLISCSLGSYIFTIGHNVAYGLNQQAKISAFIFEFLVQSVNQVTGIFLSWLPHTLHNAVVLMFVFTIILSIGSEVGTLLSLIPIRKKVRK